ncbi:MAG: hypothetical protein AAB874_01770 [Patescibacteria group bacterium]
MMNKFIISTLFSLPLGLALVMFAVTHVSAETICNTTQYGGTQYGGTSCPQNLVVNKLVRNPITGVYVENLLSGDAAYSPRSEVVYELRITNSGSSDFDRVQVEDRVESELVNPKPVEPGIVETIEYPNKQTVRFVIRNLKSGETRSVLVKAEVVSDVATGDQNRKCEVTNTVRVEAANQQPDEDSADLCIVTPQTPQVLGAKGLPEAGISDYLPLVPFMGMGLTGIMLILKKK